MTDRSGRLAVGVLGSTSTVARLAVLPALSRSTRCHLAATASRVDPTATYSSYRDLVEDPSLDAVYLPLPNSLHREWAVACCEAGKHVLCEKPLAPTAADAQAIAAAAESAGVVVMEAYMTPFHPRDRAVTSFLASGGAGDLRFAEARFTFALDRPGDHRWRPEMGGGALRDVGIYCLAPILTAAGVDLLSPGAVPWLGATAHFAPSGVDATLVGLLDLGEGRAASICCSFEAPERQLLELVGTTAAVRVAHAFTPGRKDRTFEVVRGDGSVEVVETKAADPYLEMVEHFGAVVAGDAEPLRPIEQSVGLAVLVDRLTDAARHGAPGGER